MYNKLFIIFFCLFGGLIAVNAQTIQEGNKAPDFRLYALDGSINTLESYKNKVVVIKMWFTTCTPC